MMIRAIVVAVVPGTIQRFTATGRVDETITDRELFQHYGITSRPLGGAEFITIREGNQIVAIASDDRRYRITLENGEVALYDDQAQKIHLKRNREIEISGCDTLVATCAVSAIITAPSVTITASDSITLDTPQVTCTGSLSVVGNIDSQATITAANNISDAGGAKTMAGMRAVYDTHVHGSSTTPSQVM